MQLFRALSSPAARSRGGRSSVRDYAAKALVVIAVAVLGWITWEVREVYQARQTQDRHHAERELHLINQWQAESVAKWRNQRLADARALSEDALLAQALAQWRGAPSPAHESLLTERLRVLQEQARYSGAYLLDTQGRLLLSAQGATDGHAPQAEQQALQRALTSAQVSTVEPRRDPFFAFPFVSLLAPLFQGSEPIGAVWLVSDVRTELYPLAEKWPTASQSAESSIVVRSDTEVLFLSPLRHRENAELSLRISLAQQDDPAVQAVQGARGIFYATDYRSIAVLAAASSVPGSAWFVVSKIDTADVFANTKTRAVLALSLPITLGLLFAGLVFAALQRRGRLREQNLKLELQRNMQWLEGAQKAAAIGYFAYDTASQTFTLSSMACSIFDFPENDIVLLGQWANLIHPECRAQVLAQHQQALEQRQSLRMQYRICRSRDQETRWIQVWGEFEAPSAALPHGRVTGTVQDITERKQTEQALADYRQVLEQKVRLDPLTHIANRRALDEHVSTQWQRAMRNQRPLALMMIDIDHFKRYNDHYGHVEGDECLKRVAHTLAAMASRTDEMVARYGGEEFAVLLPDTEAAQALEMAEKMCTAIRSLEIAHAGSSTASHVTISIGVAFVQPRFFGSKLASQRTADASAKALQGADQDAHANAELAQALDGIAAQALFEQADAALYAAKQQGRNRAVLQPPLILDTDDA